MREKRKTRTGTVIGDKMDKTVVVLVESLRRHPLYKKVVRHTSKFKAHDDPNTCKVGDVVRIVETRPLSKDKCWRVVEIIGRKEVAEKEPSEVI
jgi:small subunit ribosomal protein S17